MRSVKITEADPQVGPQVEIIISPLRVLRVLTWTTAAVLLINLAVLASRVLTGHGHLLGFGSMFYVGEEANVPTWYSSSLLLLCSALLWIIACATKRAYDGRSRWWTALSVVFLLMSIDETATIHERIGGLCEYVFRTQFFGVSPEIEIDFLDNLVGVRPVGHQCANIEHQLGLMAGQQRDKSFFGRRIRHWQFTQRLRDNLIMYEAQRGGFSRKIPETEMQRRTATPQVAALK